MSADIQQAGNVPSFSLGLPPQGRGCSSVVKTVIVAGLAFIALGIALAFVPHISPVASRALIGIGSPILAFSLITGIWQMKAIDPVKKWKITLLAATILLAAGITIASTLSGAPALIGSVCIAIGSTMMIGGILGWASYAETMSATKTGKNTPSTNDATSPSTIHTASLFDKPNTAPPSTLSQVDPSSGRRLEGNRKIYFFRKKSFTGKIIHLIGTSRFNALNKKPLMTLDASHTLTAYLSEQSHSTFPIQGTTGKKQYMAWVSNNSVYVLLQSISDSDNKLANNVSANIHQLTMSKDGTYTLEKISFKTVDELNQIRLSWWKRCVFTW